MNRKIFLKLSRPIAILMIVMFSGLFNSCKKEEEDNTGLLLLLFAWAQSQNNTYLLTIPNGVAKSQ